MYSVLVVGPRKGILSALRRRGIRFAVWRESGDQQIADSVYTLTAPFVGSSEKLQSTITKFIPFGPFSHVLGCTESGVYPAALARRVLGARLSHTATIIRCHDKLAMKTFLKSKGIPMTDFLPEGTVASPSDAFSRLGNPVVKKERTSSGGKGIHIVESTHELTLAKKSKHILERYVAAPEASVESFIHDYKIQFTNVTEYYVKKHINFVPAGFADEMIAEVLALNERVIRALNINWGMAHLEVYLTPEGPIFGEIALRPPGGYITDALRHAYGFDPWDAFLQVELGETFEFPKAPTFWTAVHILHPGSGTLTGIEGWDEVTARPGVVESHLKIGVGDDIPERTGVGKDIGHIIHRAESASSRLRDAKECSDLLKFHVQQTIEIKKIMTDELTTKLKQQGLTLRRANSQDGREVYNLVEKVLAEYQIKGDPGGTDQCLEDIDKNYLSRGGDFEVLLDANGKIQGAYGVYPSPDNKRTCELRKMYFSPSIRGKGIGRAILQRAIQRAKELGFTRMELETASALVEARSLYATVGFAKFKKSNLPHRCDEAWYLSLK